MNKREGLFFKTNEGFLVKIVKYDNYDNVVYEIQDDYKHKGKTNWNNIIKGKIKNPYKRSVYGVGYFGAGEYKSRIRGALTGEYKSWQSMLQRCYDEKHLLRQPSYIGCTVCEEWHNFQNFAKWYKNNYYEVKDKVMCLDKDILIKKNKEYSPASCIFVPQEINLIFANHTSSRGNAPIGVFYNKKLDKYLSHVVIENKFLNLGHYDTKEIAFNVYKEQKEAYLKQVANYYKELIPNKLYKALLNWKIEIND